MYGFEEVAADPAAFRRAVAERRAFKPLYVKVKLIYGCNLKCEMCKHWHGAREAPLSMERFQELVSELAELGCRKLHFSGGEPLLRPRVPELTEHAAGLGLRVNLTTNGTLVDKEMAKRLIVAGLRAVNVSLDSPERSIHDQVRGERGAWKLTTRAVEHFRRYARKGKLEIRLNTVVSRHNYDSLAALPDLAHSLGVDGLTLIPVDDHCGEHLALRKADLARYNAEIGPRIAERAVALGLMRRAAEAFPFGHTRAELNRARHGRYALGYYERHPCFAPWTHSLIDFNGSVYICCMTREQIPPLGNVRTASFREVWEGPGYAQIRKMMHPPALPMCARCDDFLEENRRWEAIGSGEAGRDSWTPGASQ